VSATSWVAAPQFREEIPDRSRDALTRDADQAPETKLDGSVLLPTK